MSKIGKVTGALALAAMMGATPALAQDFRTKQGGDLVIGLGAIGVLPENSGGNTSIGGRPRASNSATGQVDFTYFINRNISLNLIAASTQHEVTAKGTALGTVNLGKIWVLPPTLTLQYHPLPDSRFSPYFGAGLNYSLFYAYSRGAAPAAITNLHINPAFGFALNAGLDIAISGPWSANIDVKKIFMSPNYALSTTLGTKVHGRTDLNPLVVGASLRYRFSL